MSALSGSEKRRFDSKFEKLLMMRGEAIHWTTEIEGLLESLVVQNLIRAEYEEVFSQIMRWEDFRFSTKVRMFGLIEFPQKHLKMQKKLVKELESLSRVRNRFAHSPSVFYGVPKKPLMTALVVKGTTLEELHPREFKKFLTRCYQAIEDLRSLLPTWIPPVLPDSFPEEDND
jgi:hypothetical protein